MVPQRQKPGLLKFLLRLLTSDAGLSVELDAVSQYPSGSE
jgi:hypothetical protein